MDFGQSEGEGLVFTFSRARKGTSGGRGDIDDGVGGKWVVVVKLRCVYGDTSTPGRMAADDFIVASSGVYVKSSNRMLQSETHKHIAPN